MSHPIDAYWHRHYCTDHCTLCGNSGVIDTRGVTTYAGVEVGRLNWCICPNGRTLRRQLLPGTEPDARFVKGHGTHREWFERAKMAEQKLSDLVVRGGKEHLHWIHERLVKVYNESRFVDYMWKLRDIIHAYPE